MLKAAQSEQLAAATRVAERKEAETTSEPENVTPEQPPIPASELRKELSPVAGKEGVAREFGGDFLPVLWQGQSELEPIEEGEPADQAGWLRRGFNRARNALTLAPVNIPHRVAEWARRTFTDQAENGERQIRRSRVALAVGGLAVAVGGVYLASKGFGGGETVMAAPQPGSRNGAGSEVAAQALGWTDTINPRDGLTNSIMDYASQHGVKISSQRAFDIFNQLNAEHLIDPSLVTGSAPMEVIGGVGYVASGQSVWAPEPVARMHELLGLQ